MQLHLTHTFSFGSAIHALSLLPDGRLLAGPLQHAAGCIDLRTHESTDLPAAGPTSYGQLRFVGARAPAPLVGVDGCALVFVGLDGAVVETRKSGFQRAYTTLTEVAVHAGRGLVALGAPDGVLRVHDVSRARNTNFKGPRGNLDGVAFDAGATRVAARSSSEHHVTVWDLATRAVVTTIPSPTWGAIGVGLAFTPSGDQIAGNVQTWNGDPATPARQNLGLYSAATGEGVALFPSERYVMGLSFLDATRVAVASGFNLARHFVEVRAVTDGATLALAEVPCWQRQVLALPDGRVATGGTDGVVRLFTVAP